MGNNNSEQQKDQTFVVESRTESKDGSRGILKDRLTSYQSKGSSRSSSSSSDRSSFYDDEDNRVSEAKSIKKSEMASPGIPDERKSKIRFVDSKPLGVGEKIDANCTELIYKLKKFGIDKHPELGDDYTLFLDLENNYDGVSSFLKESKNLRFDSIRKVSNNLSFLDV